MTDTNTAPVLAGLPGLEPLARARFGSLSRAAQEIGEPCAPLYDIARGRTNPTAATIRRLCEKLNASADVLLGIAPASVAAPARVAQHRDPAEARAEALRAIEGVRDAERLEEERRAQRSRSQAQPDPRPVDLEVLRRVADANR